MILFKNSLVFSSYLWLCTKFVRIYEKYIAYYVVHSSNFFFKVYERYIIYFVVFDQQIRTYKKYIVYYEKYIVYYVCI